MAKFCAPRPAPWRRPIFGCPLSLRTERGGGSCRIETTTAAHKREKKSVNNKTPLPDCSKTTCSAWGQR
eukprot:11172588-Lingulodinium_polyedra.AAC.1